MKRVYERPLMTAELFEANEYVAACYSVACAYDAANQYEQQHNNSQQSHGAAGCGNGANQYLVDTDGNGTVDVMREYSSDLAWLECTIYTDDTYKTPMTNLSALSNGAYIYWTTSAEDLYTHNMRTWHHQGYVTAADASHPNRS